MKQKRRVIVELSKSGEAYDWAGYVFCDLESEQLLAETADVCWNHATQWLKQFGVELPPDYEIEEERGDYQYIYHEQFRSN